ncbi:MAG: hypothetical protein JWO38_2005 [Gemmataceae bacterium]|nr:hypothetical protein [Gemmataceae bacterium]
MLREARGVVLHKPEVVRPLWLILRNATGGRISVAWISYRITLGTGLSTNYYSISGNLPLEKLPVGGESKVGMLDLDAWDYVRAEVTAVTATPPPELPTADAKPAAALTYEPGPRDLRIVAYCPTGASFSQPAQVTFDLPQEKVKVRFRDASARETLCVTRYHGLPGLLAVIDLPQRSGDLLQHAFQATAICDGVVSTAFALTLADMRESFPVLVIDATPGLKDRPFINFFADQVVMGRRAHLDPADWPAKATSMLEKASNRIGRALRWLRKMHTEDDILDRFVAGWTGLETLNPELCAHFGVPDSADDIRDCGCGRKLVRKVPRANGLKELFVREGMKGVYDKCSKARNGLVHGFETIAGVTAVAREHTSDVGLMLAKGIRILSGIPVPTEPDKFTWLNGFRVASLLLFEGTMRCGEVDAYEQSYNEMPLCEFTVRQEGGVVDAKTVLHGKANIRVPPDCTVTPKGMGVSGPAKISDLRVE